MFIKWEAWSKQPGSFASKFETNLFDVAPGRFRAQEEGTIYQAGRTVAFMHIYSLPSQMEIVFGRRLGECRL